MSFILYTHYSTILAFSPKSILSLYLIIVTLLLLFTPISLLVAIFSLFLYYPNFCPYSIWLLFLILYSTIPTFTSQSNLLLFWFLPRICNFFRVLFHNTLKNLHIVSFFYLFILLFRLVVLGNKLQIVNRCNSPIPRHRRFQNASNSLVPRLTTDMVVT